MIPNPEKQVPVSSLRFGFEFDFLVCLWNKTAHAKSCKLFKGCAFTCVCDASANYLCISATLASSEHRFSSSGLNCYRFKVPFDWFKYEILESSLQLCIDKYVVKFLPPCTQLRLINCRAYSDLITRSCFIIEHCEVSIVV